MLYNGSTKNLVSKKGQRLVCMEYPNMSCDMYSASFLWCLLLGGINELGTGMVPNTKNSFRPPYDYYITLVLVPVAIKRY